MIRIGTSGWSYDHWAGVLSFQHRVDGRVIPRRMTQFHRHRDSVGHDAQEVVEPRVVAFHRRMQLDEQRLVAIAQCGPAPLETRHPRFG